MDISRLTLLLAVIIPLLISVFISLLMIVPPLRPASFREERESWLRQTSWADRVRHLLLMLLTGIVGPVLVLQLFFSTFSPGDWVTLAVITLVAVLVWMGWVFLPPTRSSLNH